MNEIPYKYRAEYENIVISLINSGWGRSDAQFEARERIEERIRDREQADLYKSWQLVLNSSGDAVEELAEIVSQEIAWQLVTDFLKFRE